MKYKLPPLQACFGLAAVLYFAFTMLACGGGAATQGPAAQQSTLTLSSASLNFGNVTVGNSKNQGLTLTNSAGAGGSNITVTQIASNGTGFTVTTPQLPFTLSPGQNATVTGTFAPKSQGSANGTLSISIQGAGSANNVPMSGDGVAPGSLSANPTSITFGNVQVGGNLSDPETVTNTGGTTVTISQANMTGAAFSYSGLSLPTTLTAGQSLTFTLTFAPSAAGTVNGSLSLVSDAANSPTVISLSGTGSAAGQLAVSPVSLNFGNVVVGSSSALGGNLNATGASVTVSSASSNSSEFVLSGISFPAQIAAGQSLPFTVTFTPQASGVASATMSFVSNASNSPTQQSLTGTGVAPPAHSVDLSWNASASQDVVGYNVYRGGSPGGPYSAINGSIDPSLTYTDNNVSAGQTYYYVVTAVNGSGQESGYSNQAKAVIPTP